MTVLVDPPAVCYFCDQPATWKSPVGVWACDECRLVEPSILDRVAAFLSRLQPGGSSSAVL